MNREIKTIGTLFLALIAIAMTVMPALGTVSGIRVDDQNYKNYNMSQTMTITVEAKQNGYPDNVSIQVKHYDIPSGGYTTWTNDSAAELIPYDTAALNGTATFTWNTSYNDGRGYYDIEAFKNGTPTTGDATGIKVRVKVFGSRLHVLGWMSDYLLYKWNSATTAERNQFNGDVSNILLDPQGWNYLPAT